MPLRLHGQAPDTCVPRRLRPPAPAARPCTATPVIGVARSSSSRLHSGCPNPRRELDLLDLYGCPGISQSTLHPKGHWNASGCWLYFSCPRFARLATLLARSDDAPSAGWPRMLPPTVSSSTPGSDFTRSGDAPSAGAVAHRGARRRWVNDGYASARGELLAVPGALKVARRTAPGENPRNRLNALLNAASDS